MAMRFLCKALLENEVKVIRLHKGRIMTGETDLAPGLDKMTRKEALKALRNSGIKILTEEKD